MEQILDPYMEEKLNIYYDNDASKLHRLIHRVFYEKFGGIKDRDMDQFYSVANDVFTDIVKFNRYDSSKGEFEGFLYTALYKAFIDEFKYQNRDKRRTKVDMLDGYGKRVLDENGKVKKVIIPDISIDAPIGDSENLTYGDTLQSDFSMDDILEGNIGGFENEKVEKYLSSLSKIQRQIILLKMDGVPVKEIKKKLGLSNKQYEKNFQGIKLFNNIKFLFNKDDGYKNKSEEDSKKMSSVTQTMEKSKPDRLSIASINKKIEKHTIRFDHPLQRESEQWTPAMKGNLISDILQGNPIPALVFAEQIVNGIAITWDLDGKQRSTNAYLFSKDGYRISKNIRRWMIEYQAPVLNDNGEVVFDDSKFPIYEKKEFDIRGKKFSELPEELQEKFYDYNFEIVQYLNCSSEDIAYHIARYNEGKPMTASQKGITRLGEDFAGMVKAISNMSFFKDMGGYKVSEFKNGTINRVVVESVMAANYLNDWKKKQEDMCEYLKENATSSDFDNFEDMVERLEKVVTDDVSDMFDSKDSFLWFGLFAKFTKTGISDEKFIDFMAEFIQSLHTRKINDNSYDDINGKSTKDRKVVIAKMNHLEKLMNEFLGISESEDINIVNTETFISKYVELPYTEVTKDIDYYEDTLNDLEDNAIKDGSKLLEADNRLSLLAIVAYSFKNDIDLDDWMVEYASKNNTYFIDQKKNFLYMKEDLEKYLKKGKVA